MMREKEEMVSTPGQSLPHLDVENEILPNQTHNPTANTSDERMDMTLSEPDLQLQVK